MNCSWSKTKVLTQAIRRILADEQTIRRIKDTVEVGWCEYYKVVSHWVFMRSPGESFDIEITNCIASPTDLLFSSQASSFLLFIVLYAFSCQFNEEYIKTPYMLVGLIQPISIHSPLYWLTVSLLPKLFLKKILGFAILTRVCTAVKTPLLNGISCQNSLIMEQSVIIFDSLTIHVIGKLNSWLLGKMLNEYKNPYKLTFCFSRAAVCSCDRQSRSTCQISSHVPPRHQ